MLPSKSLFCLTGLQFNHTKHRCGVFLIPWDRIVFHIEDCVPPSCLLALPLSSGLSWSPVQNVYLICRKEQMTPAPVLGLFHSLLSNTNKAWPSGWGSVVLDCAFVSVKLGSFSVKAEKDEGRTWKGDSLLSSDLGSPTLPGFDRGPSYFRVHIPPEMVYQSPRELVLPFLNPLWSVSDIACAGVVVLSYSAQFSDFSMTNLEREKWKATISLFSNLGITNKNFREFIDFLWSLICSFFLSSLLPSFLSFFLPIKIMNKNKQGGINTSSRCSEWAHMEELRIKVMGKRSLLICCFCRAS